MCISCGQIIEKEENDVFEGYDIPDYFHSQIIEKENSINELISKNSNYSAFVFFSDAHWDNNYKHSPELIRHIVENTGIKKVFFGGDAINGCERKEDALRIGNDFKDAFSFITDFYPVIGNHDTNRIKATIDKPEAWFTTEEIRSYLFRNIKTNEIIYYGGDFYYYFNDESTKTRFVFLDSGNNDYSESQIFFIREALTLIPDGWHIVIITHIILNASDYFDENTLYLTNCAKMLIRVVDSYNERKDYCFNDNIRLDFSKTTCSIELIIGGHIHRDWIGQTEGGTPIVALDCDGRFTYSPEGGEKGTINEQCVTVVLINHENNHIRMFRIGRGEDIII